MLAKLKLADISFFAAAWWPYANFDRLRVAAYLSIWVWTAIQAQTKAVGTNIRFDSFSFLPGTMVGAFPSAGEPADVLNCPLTTETDSSEFSSLLNSWQQGQSFRETTLSFVKQSLGFEKMQAEMTLSPLIHCFKPVGDAMRDSCSLGKSRNEATSHSQS